MSNVTNKGYIGPSVCLFACAEMLEKSNNLCGRVTACLAYATCVPMGVAESGICATLAIGKTCAFRSKQSQGFSKYAEMVALPATASVISAYRLFSFAVCRRGVAE